MGLDFNATYREICEEQEDQEYSKNHRQNTNEF